LTPLFWGVKNNARKVKKIMKKVKFLHKYQKNDKNKKKL
jgi:hypothetical protein